LNGVWVPHDVRDQIVDFVRRWSDKTEIGVGRFIAWLGIAASKFYNWRERYGKVNEHNGWVPRDFWLEDWEKKAIVNFHLKNPLEGYRRLTFMMLAADIVAVSPSSVWRVLGQAGLLAKWKGKPSKKGTGFEQPPQAHEHWHIDVSYINISGTLRIGVFGAVRPLKNLMSSAGAALEISRRLRVPLELWISGGRSEGGGETVLAAVREMLAGLPNVDLITNGWQSWPNFRKTVAHMHLLLQPSYTESFNMVTADGAAEGVASVVSEAIDWAPADWKADVDDVLDIARVGRQLLCDGSAAEQGLHALKRYIADGIRSYREIFHYSMSMQSPYEKKR
jgi:hypothetical protein